MNKIPTANEFIQQNPYMTLHELLTEFAKMHKNAALKTALSIPTCFDNEEDILTCYPDSKIL